MNQQVKYPAIEASNLERLNASYAAQDAAREAGKPSLSIKGLNYEGLGATFHDGDRHFRVGFPSGKFFALGEEPTGALPAVNAVRNALEVVLTVENKIVGVKNDKLISDLVKKEKIDALMEDAKKGVERFAEQAVAYDISVANREAEMYTVPPIEKTDAVTYLEDSDIRRYYLAMNGEKRTAALEEIQNGKNNRALLALLRSPIPLPEPFNEVAEGSWEKSIRETKRREVTILRSDRESADWAQQGIAQLRRLVRGK